MVAAIPKVGRWVDELFIVVVVVIIIIVVVVAKSNWPDKVDHHQQ